jgi:hypothetical protein
MATFQESSINDHFTILLYWSKAEKTRDVAAPLQLSTETLVDATSILHQDIVMRVRISKDLL